VSLVDRRTLRRIALLLAIVLAQFALFETGLRLNAASEAAPGFRELFMPDDQIGYRLRPGARTHYVTREFQTDIEINDAGVRDTPIAPKAPNERRIVILGDSLVMAVQVPLEHTFGKQLEARLNASAVAPARYRVINAGVQGYGPVEELLFYQKVAAAFQPNLVIVTLFVANDASDAFGSAWRLSPTPQVVTTTSEGTLAKLRRLARSSMVYQIVRMRLQLAADRIGAHTPERPLQAYLSEDSPDIDRGLEITKQCMARLDALQRPMGRTALVLMPARMQVDDADFGHLQAAVKQLGGTLVRDAATNRFKTALEPLGLPMLDPLPTFHRALPGPDIFFQSTVHLTPHGHDLLAATLEDFIREQGLLEPRPLESAPPGPAPSGAAPSGAAPSGAMTQ
jgi:lysophospholipase L1-like esterase